MTFEQFVRSWELRESKTQRLGQFFCNTYVKGTMPELFYEVDERAAKRKIIAYLKQYQYWPNMPHPV